MKKKTLVMVVILLAVLMTVIPALADAPGEGTVVEGVSAPGIALGDTRDEVEDAYGPPIKCVSNNDPAFKEWCSFDVAGGGGVSVFFQRPGGGIATGSPDDVAQKIRWGGEEVDWVTTAGISTRLAKYDKQAAIDAYPNGDLIYDSVGRLFRLHDPELGIEITWNHAYLFFTVSMSIFEPYTPPPPPVPIRVADIQMSYDRRSVTADVLILDDQDNPVEGAGVSGFWVYPFNKSNNTNMFFSGSTGTDGIATFEIGDKARPGEYRITIENVTNEGYVFDRDNSILVMTIDKSR